MSFKSSLASAAPDVGERTMCDEFDSLDAIEKAAVKAALNRCRALAAQIESELRKKRSEHFVDKLSLADFYAPLEQAADILGQKKSVENTPARAGKGLQARHHQ